MDGDLFCVPVYYLPELLLETLKERAAFGGGKELVESIIDLEDDLGPEGNVLGEERSEEADSVHRILLVEVVEQLVLELVLDVVEDLEE